MPSGAAAYAYIHTNAKGGEYLYGASIMGTATDTDFVIEGYNWYTACKGNWLRIGSQSPI